MESDIIKMVVLCFVTPCSLQTSADVSYKRAAHAYRITLCTIPEESCSHSLEILRSRMIFVKLCKSIVW